MNMREIILQIANVQVMQKPSLELYFILKRLNLTQLLIVLKSHLCQQLNKFPLSSFHGQHGLERFCSPHPLYTMWVHKHILCGQRCGLSVETDCRGTKDELIVKTNAISYKADETTVNDFYVWEDPAPRVSVPSNVQLTFALIALMQSHSAADSCEPVELNWLLPLSEVPRAAGRKQRGGGGVMTSHFVFIWAENLHSNNLDSKVSQKFAIFNAVLFEEHTQRPCFNWATALKTVGPRWKTGRSRRMTTDDKRTRMTWSQRKK